MNALRTALLLASLWLLSSCSSGTSINYYLLEPTINAPAELSNDTSLEILDLEVPQYMERFQIASRRSDSQVVFSTTHQWGENLRKNITRVMARNLIHELATPNVGTQGSRLSSPADYKVKIYVESFERGADGYVYLIARWQLLGAGGRSIRNASYENSSSTRIEASSYSDTVRAMNDLLGHFSQEIANVVRSVQ